MKKLIGFILIFMLGALSPASSQVTFNPTVFTAEDEVTLTVDVTGEPVAGLTDVYIWIFSNPNGAVKNGVVSTEWTNSPAAAKMTSAGPNKWSFKFTGTTMFGQTPAELKDFGFLVKTKDGSKQTKDYKPFAFDPLVFTPTKLRIFPSKVDKDDVVTVNFDKSLGSTVEEQRMDVSTATITMFDDNGTQVGNALTITAKKAETNVWSAVFIGASSFTPAVGRTLKKFRFKFNGTVKDVNGVPSPVSSTEAEIEYTTLK